MPMLFRASGDHPAVSLGDLEAFDPQAPPARGAERRFCCPLPGPCSGKPVDGNHRSLAVNVETGLFTCYRCQGSGKLREHWQPSHQARQARLRRAFALPAPAAPLDEGKAAELAEQLALAVPIAGTPGARYLERRGIAEHIATGAGVLYSPSFYGRPAVLFPLCDRDGALVALGGRYVGAGTPKARIAGNGKPGVFLAHRDALDVDPLVIVEGPACALTFARCGVPAIALNGVDWPAWLPKVAAFRKVIIGLDADGAGDDATAKLIPALRSFGAKPERWRPTDFKDWNEMLTGTKERPGIGLDGFRASVTSALDVPWWRNMEAAGIDPGRPSHEVIAELRTAGDPRRC